MRRGPVIATLLLAAALGVAGVGYKIWEWW